MLQGHSFQDILIEGVANNVARFASRNDVATSFRLLNRAARGLFSSHVSVHLSEPVNPDAFRRHWLAPGATRALSRQKRKQLLCLTATSGSIPTLEAALEAAALVPSADLADAASMAGQLETCQWLQQRGFPVDFFSACAGAASAGHLHVCEGLAAMCGEGLRDDVLQEGACAAAEGGNVALMEQLLPKQEPKRLQLVGAIAKSCPLEVLQRLHAEWLGERRRRPEDEGDYLRRQVVNNAAGSRTPDWAAKLEWLEALAYPLSWEACEDAAASPDAVARLQWLRQRGYYVLEVAVPVAAATGNVPALEFLLSRPAILRVLVGVGVDVVDEAAERAIGAGHLDVLQTLRVHGCLRRRPQLEFALRCAVRRGNVAVAAWCLGELRCAASPLLDGTDDDPDGADPAASGSVEMLSWLQAQGVRWGRQSLAAAVGSGCEEAVEWLPGHGCPMPVDGESYLVAACHNDLAMLRCLRRCGCPWGDDIPQGRRPFRADLSVMAWFQREGCTAAWLRLLGGGGRDVAI